VGARRAWPAGTAVAALAVAGLLWLGVTAHWGWLAGLDTAVLAAAHRFGADRPGWVTGWDVCCTVFGPMTLRAVAAVMAVVAWRRGARRSALLLVTAVVLNAVVIEAVKFVVDRPRPASAFVAAHSSSFPSGHAFGVLAGVAALLVVGRPRLGRAWWWLVALGAVLVAAIGIGRVVLNVHHPSDVLAGWALGYAWFAGCLLVTDPARDAAPAAPGSGP